jgi:ribosomal protein S20
MAKVGVLTTIRGYDNPEERGDSQQAISEAVSQRQKALATIAYATLVHNNDPAEAKSILGNAVEICNSGEEWAQDVRKTIEYYRERWG